ncbi:MULTISPECIES: potassium channel family protein [Phaeobacter]|uniref:Ion channel n=1 Tax=Phaeobacter piscinae TaxID=1580596 RepID=A0ABM7D8H3_9RHOB|nr:MULTISPECIES: potassium channel family protein [Phaeobacter]ATG35682.1 putative ion channel [Phaeobacter piscinae]ATG39617.1 putative ion channel [Phaeobacter piscinae]AUQ86203.1 putative ion channel [Phaeobacter piscinae]AUR24086.1 putative ion channel [Phaeobacter piscinae]KII18102.1 Ion transport 2 [Phaeobacter sp. S60]
MTLIQQLLLGSLYLGICLVVEAGLLVLCIHVLRKRLGVLQRGRHFVQISAILAVAIGLIVFAHTLQVWIWATALIFSGAIGDWNTAIYFSLATYTTLGYGDIVLGEGMRIFAAFGAVTGLFAFGISTAFLVAALREVFLLEDTAPVSER